MERVMKEEGKKDNCRGKPSNKKLKTIATHKRR